MDDLKQELKKLDPRKLLDEILPMETMSLHEWDLIFPVPPWLLSSEYQEMISKVPNVPFEVRGKDSEGEDYRVWCIIPIANQAAMDEIMGIGKMIDDGSFSKKFYIEGDILPENLDLVPEGITPILGRFIPYDV